MSNYIAYYRVSTKEQGDSRLGLDAQKRAVATFISSQGASLIHEYSEVQSGKKKDRRILREAIDHACATGAILVVKCIDRLSRAGLAIMVEMEERKVKFIESDSPHDTDLVREIKLSIAREEARQISERTKNALSVIKQRIETGQVHTSKTGNIVKSLGNPQNLSRKAVDKSVSVRMKAARDNANNVKAGAMINALADAGKNYKQITEMLNITGFVTSRGNKFSVVQTKRLHERYKEAA